MSNLNISKRTLSASLGLLSLLFVSNCNKCVDKSASNQKTIETVTVGKRSSFKSFWIHRGQEDLPGIREGLPSLLESRLLVRDSTQVFEYTWNTSQAKKQTSWFYMYQDSLIYLDSFEYSNSEEF